MEFNTDTIETFKELMDEIVYSWTWQEYDQLRREVCPETGVPSFTLNKLYISPTEVQYKTENCKLAVGVFDKLEEFYKLLCS